MDWENQRIQSDTIEKSPAEVGADWVAEILTANGINVPNFLRMVFNCLETRDGIPSTDHKRKTIFFHGDPDAGYFELFILLPLPNPSQLMLIFKNRF